MENRALENRLDELINIKRNVDFFLIGMGDLRERGERKVNNLVKELVVEDLETIENYANRKSNIEIGKALAGPLIAGGVGYLIAGEHLSTIVGVITAVYAGVHSALSIDNYRKLSQALVNNFNVLNL